MNATEDKDQEIARLRAELDNRTEVVPEEPADPRDAEIAKLRAALEERYKPQAPQEPEDTGPVSREEYNKLRKEMDDLIRRNSQTTQLSADAPQGGEPELFHHHLSDGRVVDGTGHGTLWSEIIDGVETLTPIIASYVRKVA